MSMDEICLSLHSEVPGLEATIEVTPWNSDCESATENHFLGRLQLGGAAPAPKHPAFCKQSMLLVQNNVITVGEVCADHIVNNWKSKKLM